MQRELLFDAIYVQLYSLTNKQLSLLLLELRDLNTAARASQEPDICGESRMCGSNDPSFIQT